MVVSTENIGILKLWLLKNWGRIGEGAVRMFGNLPYLNRIIKRKCQFTNTGLPHVSKACIGLLSG
jgi:hypothetical protein